MFVHFVDEEENGVEKLNDTADRHHVSIAVDRSRHPVRDDAVGEGAAVVEIEAMMKERDHEIERRAAPTRVADRQRHRLRTLVLDDVVPAVDERVDEVFADHLHLHHHTHR